MQLPCQKLDNIFFNVVNLFFVEIEHHAHVVNNYSRFAHMLFLSSYMKDEFILVFIECPQPD